jgi:AbrB family looped-hinge helix DNA binding protein
MASWDLVTLKIDKVGRIVVPKSLRDRLGLRAGIELEVTESVEGLTLKPISDQPSMVKVDGFWVHTGVAPAGFDWIRFAKEERELQNRRPAGL